MNYTNFTTVSYESVVQRYNNHSPRSWSDRPNV